MKISSVKKYNTPNLVFILSLIVFFLDAIVNRFISIPIYVSTLPIFTLTLLFLYKNIFLYVFILFSTLLLASSYFYSLTIEDIGYFFYFLFFIFSFFYLKKELLNNNIILSLPLFYFIFFLTCLFFWVYLINIDYQPHVADMSAKGANIEYYREYHSGLFRAPHFPSYLFYFVSLTIFYFRKKLGKYKTFIFILICIMAILISGSRTPIFSIIFASLIYFSTSRLRNITLSFLIIILVGILFINIEFILELSKGTPFFQYLSFIYTLKNEPERLSRIQLFFVFINSVKDFSIYELFFGRSFSEQFEVMQSYIGQRLWFHNDILAIFYSYGLVGIVIFTTVIISIYIKLIRPSNNTTINIYFLSIIVFSFVNGILYHPSYIIITLLFWMLKNERSSSCIHSVR